VRPAIPAPTITVSSTTSSMMFFFFLGGWGRMGIDIIIIRQMIWFFVGIINEAFGCLLDELSQI
jgi:hypothetical protein